MSSPTPASKKPAAFVLPTQKTVIAQKAKDHVMMFYGPPGVGKTTFVNALADRVLFLSTDRGTRSLAAMRVEITTVAKLEAVLDALEKSCPYDIICLDHVDDFCHMLSDEVCSQLGIDSLGDAGYGKGWKLYTDAIHNTIARLKALNVGIVFICHEAIKTIRARGLETERTMPDLAKSASKVLIPLVDLVGFCGFTPRKTAEGKRVEIRTLTTIPREDLYAKDRTRRVKPKAEELLDGKKFIATFEAKEVTNG